jgi:Cu+-exporting ATPase
MKKIILSIDGMTCSACSNGLEKYLLKQEGIINASVNLVMSNALIEYNEEKLNQKSIEEFVKQAGFKSLGLYTDIKTKNSAKNNKVLFIIFLILAIVLMYVSMGHMIGLPTFDFLNMHTHPVSYAVTLLILTIPFIFYGFDIIKSGFKNLIHKSPNMDTLVAIGVLSSLIYSIYNMYMLIKGNHSYVEHLYFESAAIVIFFIKLGRYIDGVSKDKTKEAIQKLVQITPKDATIKVNGKEKKVTIDEINKGDTVISKPGERVSVDGTITAGKTHLDESFITGESKPIVKGVGDKVIAGSINYDGYIEYEAEKIGKESTISEIVKLVIEATNTKAPIAKIADKVSGYFVPTVIIIALITFLVYLVLGFGFASAINTFVTILVVACPCSLGLATPLAIVISEGVCATNGILVKKSETLENASKIDTIVFDKTGTLTYGTLKISKVINYSNITDNEMVQLSGSLEAKSTHPISKAFLEYIDNNKIKLLEVDKFEDISGYGIKGIVDNNTILVGNSKLLEKHNIENEHELDERKLASEGNSIVYVVKNNEILGIIGVNDIVRENAREIVRKLTNNNIEVIMLTGDNKTTAKSIGNELDIKNIIANVTPNDKSNTIKKLKEEGKMVMMCGDGINDSPALALSDIGVSVNSGTDIARDSSDVILTRNDLFSIINLINISKKTIKNIKQNLFWAFFYNSLMIPIAMGVLTGFGITINPMIASLAMVLSSFTVILNALRLKRVKV